MSRVQLSASYDTSVLVHFDKIVADGINQNNPMVIQPRFPANCQQTGKLAAVCVLSFETVSDHEQFLF